MLGDYNSSSKFKHSEVISQQFLVREYTDSLIIQNQEICVFPDHFREYVSEHIKEYAYSLTTLGIP